MKNSGLLFFISLLFTTQPFAQRYSFKNYTTNDGLVQTDITDIKQDKKGAIWIGTAGGISVFDGKEFTNYDDHDLLQSLRINALLCDSAGTMWIATRNGLLCYRNSFTIFFKPSLTQSNVVSCLAADTKNRLLFVCNDTLYQVRGNKAEKFRISKNIDNNVAMVAFDRDDQLWIVTADLKIFRKNGSVITAIRTPFRAVEKKLGLAILRVLGKEGPEPCFVTNFGAFQVVNDSLQYFAQQYPKYRNARIGPATYLLEENDSTVWVGGVAGLAKLSGSSHSRYTTENGFCDNSVSCLFTDREKNLWVGCTYNGVYKLSNEALFHLRPDSPSFDLRHVSETVSLSANKTLIGTWGKGLYVYNGDSVTKVALPTYLRYISALLPVGSYTY
ncbi:MAG TPA: two-component regulator propeller domain-containing protein, partial [Flavisolibacter sp.]|nr:two-component regulator propeller domain-containing protein [Flavisolibacter sp.]